MNPYLKGAKAYKQVAVNTQDQGTLIVMMYDGTIKFLKQSLSRLDKKDYEGAHNGIVRARAIISELLASLNIKNTGEVGQGLSQLYNYMYNRLIEANVNKDREIIEEVIRLLQNLNEAWKTIAKRKQNVPNPKLSAKVRMGAPTSIRG